VYLIAVLVIMHFWMLGKVGVYAPLPYTLLLAVLLGWRVWHAWVPRRYNLADHGMEMPDRPMMAHSPIMQSRKLVEK
jgi:DMSO/TMAO reductase YedYZ heme-binding membrane subunit